MQRRRRLLRGSSIPCPRLFPPTRACSRILLRSDGSSDLRFFSGASVRMQLRKWESHFRCVSSTNKSTDGSSSMSSTARLGLSSLFVTPCIIILPLSHPGSFLTIDDGAMAENRIHWQAGWGGRVTDRYAGFWAFAR